MKNFIYSLLFFSLIIISCKEKEPTSPEKETPQEVLVEATVGSEGGILETEDFKLLIPSGAFNSISDLKLYEETNLNEYDGNQVTSKYKLDGIPANFKKPIRLAIKYSGELSNIGYIAFGEESLVKSLGRIDTTFFLVEAVDSSGYLVCKLEISNHGNNTINEFNKSSSLSSWLNIVGVDDIHNVLTADGHFKIYGDATVTYETELIQVGNVCETAYQTFLNKGFNYSNREKWPIPIFVMELSGAWGKYSPSRYSGSNGYILLNEKLFQNPNELPVTIGHEFLHLVQDLYDPRDWNTKKSDFGARYWLDEATAIFCEEFFVGNPENYISSTFHNYKYSPLDGFHKEGFGAGDHGYGMSSVIKYLSKNFQSATILNFYEDIRLNKHPIEIIINNSNGSTDWVPAYFRDYLEGNIYKVSSKSWSNRFIEENIFVVQSNQDTIKKFPPYMYPDLSAELFIVKLKNPNWKENTNLYFTILGNQDTDTEISVYRYRDGENFDFISSDYMQVRVPYVDELTSSNFNLLGLVTNSRAVDPYTSTTTINLQIDIKEPNDIEKNYKKAFIDLHVKGYHIRTNADTSYEDQYYKFYSTDSPDQIGTTEGLSFSSSWYQTTTDNYPIENTTITKSGTISITFSENYKSIKNYTETFSINWPGWYDNIGGVSVSDIPLYQSGDEWTPDEFRLDYGEDACNHVISRSYNQTWVDGSSFIFSRNECDGESYIRITLYEN